MPVVFSLKISVRHFFFSAYLRYIFNRSPAKSADSSPPAPARISSNTFLESRGSLGSRSSFSLFSADSFCFSNDCNSSLASSFMSSSPELSNCLVDSIFLSRSLYVWYVRARDSISFFSLMYLVYVFGSLKTSGSVNKELSWLYRCKTFSMFSNIL